MHKKFGAILCFLVVFLSACLRHCEEPIRSVYIGTCENSTFDEVLNSLQKYNANAVVIDVKDDLGRLFPDLPVQSNEKNAFSTEPKLKTFFTQLKKRKIYTIARIVALKEFTRDDLCIKNENGDNWIDKEKTSWMDPSDERVRRYLEDVCSAAVKIGFDEIQLDYIRFSSYDRRSREHSRIEAINSLTEGLSNVVHEVGGKLSVCVFGCTIEGSVDTPEKKNQTAQSAKIIGQDFIEIAQRCDFICPMIYPSHYPIKTPCGIPHSDLEPYNTIKTCLELCNNMLVNVTVKAVVRPYLQAFTAKWLKKYKVYDDKAIQEQISAVYDSNFSQWGLFKMDGKYPNL